MSRSSPSPASPGGKNGAGVYQKLICCMMPPNDEVKYLESFRGKGLSLLTYATQNPA